MDVDKLKQQTGSCNIIACVDKVLCFEYVQAVQGLLALHRFKLGADSVTFNQDYVDPDQQNPPEATPTEE